MFDPFLRRLKCGNFRRRTTLVLVAKVYPRSVADRRMGHLRDVIDCSNRSWTTRKSPHQSPDRRAELKKITPPAANEPVAHLIPRRNIETDCVWQLGQPADEGTEIPTRQDTSLTASRLRGGSRTNKTNQLSALAPPSGPSGFRSCAKCSDDSLGCAPAGPAALWHSRSGGPCLPLISIQNGGTPACRLFLFAEMAVSQPAACFCARKWAVPFGLPPIFSDDSPAVWVAEQKTVPTLLSFHFPTEEHLMPQIRDERTGTDEFDSRRQLSLMRRCWLDPDAFTWRHACKKDQCTVRRAG